jgi:hypothetical protein
MTTRPPAKRRKTRGEDPKRIKARDERNEAKVCLEILCAGIGNWLQRGYCDLEELRILVTLVNTALVPAIERDEAAQEAYMPFLRYRRRRTYRPSPKPATAKKAKT